ncbi:polyprenol phosphomannose-dependent alpha 1,6 mannosyltransferase MptB [Micromonospora sp. NPDC093277]|uniref:polyprenol phosphomannose-dependent alpha 1,6 mannosyltransferase MptB n=1 Tax=Micromonospora sp. NPDC093277 TaxID=3364291 RepID=UPI00380B40F4
MLLPPTVPAYRIVGACGAALLAVAGLAVGALPVDDADSPWLTGLYRYAGPALLAGFVGLTLLVVAWWWAGRDLGGPSASRRGTVVTLTCWSAPLLLTPPLFSRDAYSYLAQGAMVLADLDVYRFGVAHLGGRLAAEVPEMWQQTPAPYGPVFLGTSAAVAAVAGTGLGLGLFGLRLVALLGVALLVLFVPRLARHCGVDPAAALWLGVLNPLVPLHLIAGAHNEALMLGLLVAGVCLAFERSYLLAVVLVTLAALVKAPAAVGLVVVAVLAARQQGRWSAIWRTTAAAAATMIAVTWATGTGYGWLTALGTPLYKHSWSISSALGRATVHVMQAGGLDPGDGPMRFWVWAGLLGAVATTAYAWFQRRALGLAYALGLVLAAAALLGPATRPWYGLWGLVPIAAGAPGRTVRLVAAIGAVVLAFVTLPSGFGPQPRQFVLAALGVLFGLITAGYLRLLLIPHRPLEMDPR